MLWWKGEYINVLVREQLIATKGTYARGVTIGLDGAPSVIVKLDMHHMEHGSLVVLLSLVLETYLQDLERLYLKGYYV